MKITSCVSSNEAQEANTRQVLCLIYPQDLIREQISIGLYTGVMLLDIQKALDSVNHTTFCKKLSALGVKSTT